MLKPNQAEALERIVEFESANLRDEPWLGWSWQDVRVHPSTLNALVLEAAIKVTFSSNSYTGYAVTDHGKQMQAEIGRASDVEQIVLPDDLGPCSNICVTSPATISARASEALGR